MIGQTLAHYEITGQLGKGGMGEVYRARDTKLGREVAIKTLPDEYARDPERLSRFEREARFLATLDHPNIAGIHGLEESGGTRFLVLELVEGQTLAERIKSDPIPLDESLRLALQIAQALEAAHDKGVVHRDLKPSNIKITPSGQVKVLDFGLAKALDTPEAADPNVDLSHSPTLSATATRRGVLMGTAAYMSPEQARGETIDLGADIWAFGAVLFEMLAGEKAFGGRTVSDILAAILKSEPDWTRLPADVHPRVRNLIERCLRKEARERPARVGEVRTEIEKALAEPDTGVVTDRAAPAGLRSWLIGATAIVLAGVVTLTAGGILFDSSDSLPLMRFGFDPPEPIGNLPEIPAVAFAPDGSRFAYTTLNGLWVRGLNEAEPVNQPGPTGWIGTPAFSPDGLALAYVNAPNPDGPFSIMRVPVGGGTPATIHIGIPSLPTDLDWDAGGTLIYTQPDGIWEVPAAGGGDARLVIGAQDGEELGSPQRLPNGNILFTSTTGTDSDRWDQATIFVAPPGSEADDRQAVREGASDPRYVESGHLIFADGTTLWAAPFSPGSGEITGERFRVVDQVFRAPNGTSDTAQYAVSGSGEMVHLGVTADDPAATVAGGGGGLGAPQVSLVWVDRTGNEEPIDVRPDRYAAVRISPDGNRVALVIGGNPIAGEPRDVWVLDLRTNDLSRLTANGESDVPIWIDNDTIMYRQTPVPVGIFTVPADGGDSEFVIRSTIAPTAYPLEVTPDGETLIALFATSTADQDLVTLSLDGMSDFEPFLAEPDVESFGTVSPNGQYLAYMEGPTPADTSVIVRPFPNIGLRSYDVGPGSHPIFSRDGSEIFYYDGQSVASVPVEYEPFDIGTPAPLGIAGPYYYGANRTWDEAPDGRFLMTRLGAPDLPQGSLEVQVVVGFSRLLEDRNQ